VPGTLDIVERSGRLKLIDTQYYGCSNHGGCRNGEEPGKKDSSYNLPMSTIKATK
jgi:hypothetical protein